MMSEKRNLPELRFQSFSENWKRIEFGEMVSNKSKKFDPSKSNEQINCIELEHLSTGSGRLLGFVDGSNQASIKSRFSKGDVLFGKLRPYLKKYLLAPFDGVCTSEIWVLRGLHVENSFLFHLIQTNKFISSANISTGSKMPRADWSSVSSIDYLIPPFPEQQKIASFLTAVDRRIELLQQKKEKLERYKKGVMQQLFTRKIRFKADDGSEFPDWEEKKLGEVYEFRTTNSFSRDKLNYDSGEYRNIHYGDIHTKFPTVVDLEEIDLPYINEDVEIRKTFSDNRVEAGDLIIADASEDYADIGKTIEIVNTAGQKVLAGLHTLHARRRDTDVEIGFGGYLMKSEPLRTQVKRIAQGTKVLSVSVPRMLELDLRIPSLEEQKKIVQFLRNLDENSKKLSQQINQSQTWKKGLFQQMFV